MNRLVWLAVALLGCSHKTEAPPPVAKDPLPAKVMPADARVADAVAAAPPVEDPKLRAAYLAGMKQGRLATSAKTYAAAIAAFDEALQAKHNDPRALAERGYARLLEGADLAEASRDLDAAASGTKDPKLLSMIWFNRGLVEEKRGEMTNAVAAFVIANTLRPSAAARAKIGTRPACAAQVSATFRVGDEAIKAIDAPDIVALAKALPHGDEPGATAAAAWQSLGFEAAPSLPVTVIAGDGDEKVGYVVMAHGTGLREVPVAEAMGGRCPGTVELEVVPGDPSAIVVHAKEMAEGGYTFMCEGAGGEPVECTGKDGEIAAGTACLGGSTVIRDLVIDPATGAVVSAVEQPEAEPPVKVALVGAHKLQLSGRGCDRAVTW